MRQRFHLCIIVNSAAHHTTDVALPEGQELVGRRKWWIFEKAVNLNE